MYKFLAATATAMSVLIASSVYADGHSETYALDPGHSQVVFTYNHLGFSRTFGMFGGFEGEIQFDEENPAASSVNVSIPILTMITGWDARKQDFMSDNFFGAKEGDLMTFISTSIEVTGESAANITGDLTMNGVTKPVVLETTLNKSAPYPFGPKEGVSTMGFEASATIVRSDFGLGAFAPAVSDEIDLIISIEALKSE